MAILKTIHAQTGSTSYEHVDSILHVSGRTIRTYGVQGVIERELSAGDQLELIEGPGFLKIDEEQK